MTVKGQPRVSGLQAFMEANIERVASEYVPKKSNKTSGGKLSRGLTSWLGKVHNGDCLDLMAKLPKSSIKVVVTSPPYNIKNSSGNGLKDGRGGKWANAALVNGYSGHDDAMPHEDYVTWQRKCLDAMMRVLKPNGAIFYNHKWMASNSKLSWIQGHGRTGSDFGGFAGS